MQALVHPDGRLVLGGLVFRAALGRGGVRRDKQEGDGATPAGPAAAAPRALPCRSGEGARMRRAGRADRADGRLVRRSVGQADYNRMIRLPHDGHYEELWRQDGVYDLVGVLGWNDAPVQRGRGSAIFLHVARSDYAPTEGCIALALGDLRQVLAAGVYRASGAARIGALCRAPAAIPAPSSAARYAAQRRSCSRPSSCR